MKSCNNCINRNSDISFCNFCFENNNCNYKYDKTKPLYSLETAKQLLFDIAMDLEYNKDIDRTEYSSKILDILNEIDKM